MEKLIKTVGTTLIVAVLLLAIDFAGLMLWVLSDQMPHDGFYIGRISAEIIKAIIL